MDVMNAMLNRRSIRAFSSEKVAKKTLLAMLGAAVGAPSARNLQPWEFVVVTGKALARLRQRLAAAQGAGEAASSAWGELPEPYRSRYQAFDAAIGPVLAQVPGSNLVAGSMVFYGAPVVIVVLQDRRLPAGLRLDAGLAIQNLLLAAEAHGLGACPIGIVLRHEAVLRQELALAAHMEPVLTVAVGKPAPEAPLNAFKAPRQDLSEFITWIEN